MTTLQHSSNGECMNNNHNKNNSSSSSQPSESRRYLLRRPRPPKRAATSTHPVSNHSFNSSNINNHNTSHSSSCFQYSSTSYYGLTLMVVVTLATLRTTSLFMELWVSSSVILVGTTTSSSSSSSSSRLQSLPDPNGLLQQQQHWTDTTIITTTTTTSTDDASSKASSSTGQSHLRTTTAAVATTEERVSLSFENNHNNNIAEDASSQTTEHLLLRATSTETNSDITTTRSHLSRPASAWKPRIVHFITASDSSAPEKQQQQQRQPMDLLLSYPLPKQQESMDSIQMMEEIATTTTPSFVTLSKDENYFKECKPMAKWQTTSFPNCNSLHEIQIASEDFVLVSLQGSWRTVWKYYYNTTTSTSPDENAVVVKLLKFERRKFDVESYELHRVDALAMERLTRGPNIVHAFGFCGQSVITELADTGVSAREYLKSTSLTSLDRLKMARDLAGAMNHVHSIDYPNSTNVTLIHNDVNMANLVQVQGRIKLNDFNIGVLQRWNTTSHSICRSPVLFAQPLWKSPEEQPHPSTTTTTSTGNNATAPTLHFVENAAATDVYGLGNLLFQILTTRQPWTHLEPNGPLAKDKVVQLKLHGGRPYIPPEFSNSTDLAVQVLYQVTMACFDTDPKHRPTSYEAFRMLDEAVRSVENIIA